MGAIWRENFDGIIRIGYVRKNYGCVAALLARTGTEPRRFSGACGWVPAQLRRGL